MSAPRTSPSLLLNFDPEFDLVARLLDQVPDELMIVRPDERIVFVNEAAAKALGHTPQDILNKPLKNFLKIKMNVDEWKKINFEELRKKKRPAAFMMERSGPGGEKRSIEVTAKYIQHRQEEYVLFVARDLTEMVSLQNELRECVDCHRLLNDQAAAGIFTLDLQGAILYANKTAKHLAGLTHFDSKKYHFENIVGPDCREKALELFHKVKGGAPIVGEELSLVTPKETVIPVELTASPIVRAGEVTQIHMIVLDISRRKQYEELVRESEKVKAAQNIIAGTTQELYHPIKGLLDHSQGLLDQYKDKDFEYIGFKEFKHLMKSIENMKDRLSYCFHTINRLMTLNKSKVGPQENCCDVNRIIRDSMKMLDHLLQVSEVRLSLKLASHLPEAAIDSLELSQVIMNILMNAVQAIPGKGNVYIKTSHQRAEDIIQIDCKDEGVGMSKETLPRVFEPFFTTKMRGLEKSSGLGLSIVYSIIKAYGGEIFIKSSLKKGTHVKILLPIFRSAQKK